MAWTESERLTALGRYEILDTPEEAEFNDIVSIAAEICGTPISLISLVTHDRQWFKAKTGLQTSETPVEHAFCKHAIREGDLFIIPDATKDPRFKNNPLVTGKPDIRFYAAAVLQTNDNLPLGTLCVIDTVPREISEQQKGMLKALARQVMAQLELRWNLKQKEISEKRYTTLLNSIGQGFCTLEMIYDESGKPVDYRYLEVNPAFERATGLKDVVGKTINSLAAGHESYWLETYDMVARTGKSVHLTNKVQALNRWYDVHAAKIGKPEDRYVAALFDDITERKNFEISLQEKDLSLRTALQAGQMGTWELDVEKLKLSCSETCNSNYGLPVDAELSYEKLFSLVHPEDQEHWKTTVSNAIETVNGFEMEYRIIWPNGEVHWIYVRGNCTTNVDGKAKTLSGVSINITARKTLEEAAHQARIDAEAANIAKTEFLANMSHEIRTPMNAVIGLSNILSMSQPLTQKQKDCIKTLQMSADSLLSLINDLLDIAKIEARTVELERVPFNLTQVINEVISILNVRAREKDLTLAMNVQAVKDLTFMGDPTRLRQILLNLCGNAIKFTEHGGVDISVKLKPSSNPSIQNVSITVSDTGIGIAKENLENIFYKFVQADSSINRKYGGTGLGLAITKTLVEIMSGSISVESEVGKGSVFKISLPLETANDTAALSNRDVADKENVIKIATKTKPRILLVEDYAANVMVASLYLEEFGCDVDIASNGAEALNMVKNNKYVAILMDVQMHGMNGFEATQLIRQHEKTNQLTPLRIIGMTAHALAGDRERCLEVGMDDYISKPFNPNDLRKKLETAFAA